MVVVLIYSVLCLIAAAPFGFALSRLMLGRMPHRPRHAAVPEEWARYRIPGQVPAVILAGPGPRGDPRRARSPR